MRLWLALTVVVLILWIVACDQNPRDEAMTAKAEVASQVPTESPLRAGLMRGLFTYMADAARFENCLDGRMYPVAMEGAYIELERAYLEHRAEPGAPLLVTIKGSIQPRTPMEGDGTIDMVVVESFEAAFPGEDCGGD